MNRNKKSVWAMLVAQFLTLTAVGCIDRVGLTRAVSDDLAFTVAAATQGFFSGLFTRNDAP